MVEIYYFEKGKIYQQQRRIVDKNDYLTTYIPNFRFFLHDQVLYSTSTQVQTLMKNNEECLLLDVLSEEEVINKYNSLNNAYIDAQKEQEILIYQNNELTNIACQDRENIQQQQNRYSETNYFINSHLHCLLPSKVNDLLEGKIIESIILSKPEMQQKGLVLQKQINHPSYRQPSQEEETIMEQNQLLLAGRLSQFVWQMEQSLSLIKQSAINRKQNDSLVVMEFKCCFCQLVVNDNFIQTPCFHTYHQECFQLSIKAQLMENQQIYQLNCLCSKKIPLTVLTLFQDQLFAKLLKMKIIYNQLQEIMKRKKHIYIKCSREFCEFFYINNGNGRIDYSYCPICLEKIINK